MTLGSIMTYNSGAGPPALDHTDAPKRPNEASDALIPRHGSTKGGGRRAADAGFAPRTYAAAGRPPAAAASACAERDRRQPLAPVRAQPPQRRHAGHLGLRPRLPAHRSLV